MKVASSTIKLGFLSALIHLVRWPDWQLPALFTRGFKVAGDIEPSNVYPRVASAAVESEHSFLDPTEADGWNDSLAKDSRPSDLDSEVCKTAQEQSARASCPNQCRRPRWTSSLGKGAGEACGAEASINTENAEASTMPELPKQTLQPGWKRQSPQHRRTSGFSWCVAVFVLGETEQNVMRQLGVPSVFS